MRFWIAAPPPGDIHEIQPPRAYAVTFVINSTKNNYFPILDGIRGLAVLLVFLSHAAASVFEEAGGIGVTIFFVLSGFLITNLLVEEVSRTGDIRLFSFYMRRILRLFPALYFLLLLCLLIFRSINLSEALLISIYLGNWARVCGISLGWLHHTWSLAIEEQFYIVWPFIVLGASRLRADYYSLLAWFAFAAALLSIFVRATLWHGEQSILSVHFRTDANAFGLFFGCMTACLFRMEFSHRIIKFLATVAITSLFLLSGLLRVIGLKSIFLYSTWFTFVPSWPIAAILSSIVILAGVSNESNTPSLIRKLFESQPLRTLGRISYGFYLWHALVIFHFYPAMETKLSLPAHQSVFGILLMFLGSLLLSVISYRYVEQPFLGLKKHFA